MTGGIFQTKDFYAKGGAAQGSCHFAQLGLRRRENKVVMVPSFTPTDVFSLVTAQQGRA